MKLKKSIGALVVAGALALSLAACGGDNGGNVVSKVGQPAAATMSPSELLSAAQKASTNNQEEAMQAKMNAVLKMSGKEGKESHSIGLNLDADLVVHTDPMKMSMKMDMDVQADGQKQSQDMQMYILEENGKAAAYMGVGGQWAKQVYDLNGTEFEQLKQQSTRSFDTDDFTKAFASDAEVLKNKGLTKLNGKDAVLLEGEIDAALMEEALKNAGIEEQLRQLQISFDDLKTKSGIKVAAYYDPETLMPLQIDMDMTDFFSELMQNVMKAAASSSSDVSIKVDEYTMSVQIVAYGDKNVPDVVLPAAAVTAQTMS